MPDTSGKPQLSKFDLRDFSEKNKIFFETIAAFLLSMMSIVVSIVQTNASNKQVELMETQNKLARLQLEISKQQASPQFLIAFAQIMDEKQGRILENEIRIRNNGGVVRNITPKSMVFLDAHFIESNAGDLRSKPNKKGKIPINGYFGGLIRTGSEIGTGLIYTLKGYRNNEKEIQFDKKYREYTNKDNNSGACDLLFYVKLEYDDLIKEKHVEYFKVNKIGGGVIIDNKEGENLEKMYDDSVKNGSIIEFDEMTPELIISKLNP